MPATSRRRSVLGLLIGGWVLASVSFCGAGAALGDNIVGTLSSNTPAAYPVGVYNASVPAPDVATWITMNVPAASKSLVVLTECYGGNAASAFGAANTAVVSATSPFQLAQYGGFDSGAGGRFP
jgi:hypothetical protein